MGAFWNCVTSSEVDVGNFKGVDEIQMRIESAYFTQQKTFSEHLTTECVPKIERARSAMGSMASDIPAGMKEALDKYLATLPKLQSGIESYAEKVKGRSAVKDVDGSIQEVGTAFSPEPSAESVAFEKFLVCAIPDLDKKKDIQEVLEFLADDLQDGRGEVHDAGSRAMRPVGAEHQQGRQGDPVEDVQGQRQEILRRRISDSFRRGSTAPSARARARRSSTSRNS